MIATRVADAIIQELTNGSDWAQAIIAAMTKEQP